MSSFPSLFRYGAAGFNIIVFLLHFFFLPVHEPESRAGASARASESRWMSLVARVRLNESGWTSPVERVRLNESGWKSLVERVRLNESGWASPVVWIRHCSHWLGPCVLEIHWLWVTPSAYRTDSFNLTHSTRLIQPDSFNRTRSTGLDQPDSFNRTRSTGLVQPDSFSRTHVGCRSQSLN